MKKTTQAFSFLIILVLILYPMSSKAEINEILRFECTSYKSLDEAKDLPAVKYLSNIEMTFFD